MKDFIRPAGRLRALPFHARLTYSIFLLFTVAALALTAWLGADMLRPDMSGYAEYYAGAPAAISSSAPSAAEPATGGGPTLDLPSETLIPRPADPIPLRKLLEVSHFHLFSMPVYLMILSHLFMLSTLSARTKSTWIILGTLGVTSHMAAPWLARSGSVASQWFYAASGALLSLPFLVMSIVPLIEMWRPQPSRS
jgi:hypothetical protein